MTEQVCPNDPTHKLSWRGMHCEVCGIFIGNQNAGLADELATEKSMHQAWRKRAEEAEAELAALRSQLKNITDNAYILENTIQLLRTENADREKAALRELLKARTEGFELAHESFHCGHARANYRDANYKPGDQECDSSKCEFCEAEAKWKAVIAAALEQASKHFPLYSDPLNDGRVMCQCGAVLKQDYRDAKPSVAVAHKKHILAITTDQSAARGVLQDEGQV